MERGGRRIRWGNWIELVRVIVEGKLSRWYFIEVSRKVFYEGLIEGECCCKVNKNEDCEVSIGVCSLDWSGLGSEYVVRKEIGVVGYLKGRRKRVDRDMWGVLEGLILWERFVVGFKV